MPSGPTDDSPGTTLDGKYRLESPIGVGGFGVVYRAVHKGLGRSVAVKILQTNVGSAAAEDVERFRLEGVSACRIDHPNAVSILDFGITQDGFAYLVMELLEGRLLSDELREGPLTLARAAEILIPICDLLAEAHASGVVHRDIKSDNIFLHRTKRGEIVKVLDFGIAKLVGSAADISHRSLTAGGVVMGTPEYMAPERVRNKTYDGRSDVYSLGILFHQMLCGRLPFEANDGDMVAVMWMQVNDAPTPIRTLNPNIPVEIEALILRTLAKDPEKRPTAAEMGDELTRITGLGGLKPTSSGAYVRAAVPTVFQDAQMFIDESPPAASPPSPPPTESTHATFPLIVDDFEALDPSVTAEKIELPTDVLIFDPRESSPNLPLVVETVEPSVETTKTDAPSETPDESAPRSETAAKAAPDAAPQSSGNSEPPSPGDALETPQSFPPPKPAKPPTPTRPVIALTRREPALPDQTPPPTRRISFPTGEIRRFDGHHYVTSIAFSPDGTFFVSAKPDKTVGLWDVETGKEIRRFGNPRMFPLRCSSVAPDGKLAVFSGADDAIRVWNLETGTEIRRLSGQRQVVTTDVSPDGRLVLSGSLDGDLRLWDLADGRETHRFTGHTDSVADAAFSPDGTLILSIGLNSDLYLWELETGKPLTCFPAEGPTYDTVSVTVSHDGRRVFGGDFNTLRPGGNEGKARIRRLDFDAAGSAKEVAFSPDGQFALSGSQDAAVRLWDVKNRCETSRFIGHGNYVTGVAFAPDGRRAVSCSEDRTIRLWDIDSGLEIHCLLGHKDKVRKVAFLPDGCRVLSCGQDGTVRLWGVPSPFAEDSDSK